MYFAIIVGFMLVLPVASILADAIVSPGSGLVFLIGKWFVFWAVGMRLLTAGIRQIVQPEFTAKTIFDIEDPAAQKVVAELGIGNLAIGVLGTGSLYFPSLTTPAALYGLIFFGFAGIRHLANRQRNTIENVATISDLWISAVLAFYLAASG